MKKTSIETYFQWYYCYSTVQYSFKWQYMAGAGAGAEAGAEIVDKGGAGAKNK